MQKSIYRQLNMTVYFKNLRDFTLISTVIDKMIQTNLTFASI